MPSTRSHLSSSTAAASPSRRIAAYFVDYFVFIVPLLGILSLGAWALRSFNINLFGYTEWLNHGIAILILTMPVVSYFALSEASRFQATVGKRLMNLSVVNTKGQRATLKQTALRAVVKFLPWESFHTIIWHWEGWPSNPASPTNLQIVAMTASWLVIGWFLVTLFVGSRRTPYDWAAGTSVIRTTTINAARNGE